MNVIEDCLAFERFILRKEKAYSELSCAWLFFDYGYFERR